MKSFLIILNIVFVSGMSLQNYREVYSDGSNLKMETVRNYSPAVGRQFPESESTMNDIYEALNELLAREYSEFKSQGGSSARGFRDYIRRRKDSISHFHCTIKRPTHFSIFNYIIDE
jgi:hypothetical protein